MLIGLGERFGKFPSQVRDECVEVLRLLQIIHMADPESQESEGISAPMTPEQREIVDEKSKLAGLGL